MKFDFVLGEVEERLEKIEDKLSKTNELLAQIEENLRVPNLVATKEAKTVIFVTNLCQ